MTSFSIVMHCGPPSNRSLYSVLGSRDKMTARNRLKRAEGLVLWIKPFR
jgi:hypothetical protein